MFLEATQDYWLAYIPITIITAMGLKLVYEILIRLKYPRIAHFLLVFSTSITLLWSCLSQNSQYLAFRCFAQLRSPMTWTSLEMFNLIFCLLVLFALVLLAAALPFLITAAGISYRLIFAHLIPNNVVAQLYLSSWLLLRVLFGFCHSSLH